MLSTTALQFSFASADLLRRQVGLVAPHPTQGVKEMFLSAFGESQGSALKDASVIVADG